MTRWNVEHGDLLDAQADGLVCSANPYLNLSGGVGGAFTLRFGESMQAFLHDYLSKNGRRYVEPGSAVLAPACGSPFNAVAHGVAIDAFYDTNAEWILKTYEAAIQGLAAGGCRTIAAACLGCGYGRVTAASFRPVVANLITRDYEGVTRVSLITTNADLADAIRLEMSGGRETS